MTNLNHFCDPKANAFPIDKDIDALDLTTRTWSKVRVKHPIHDACSGKAIKDFGPHETIVECECECHKGKQGLKVIE